MDEILHRLRSPGVMIPLYKYQTTMGSTMLSKWCEMVSFIHSITSISLKGLTHTFQHGMMQTSWLLVLGCLIPQVSKGGSPLIPLTRSTPLNNLLTCPNTHVGQAALHLTSKRGESRQTHPPLPDGVSPFEYSPFCFPACSISTEQTEETVFTFCALVW